MFQIYVQELKGFSSVPNLCPRAEGFHPFQIYVQELKVSSIESTDIKLVSCDVYLKRFSNFFIDPKDLIMTK